MTVSTIRLQVPIVMIDLHTVPVAPYPGYCCLASANCRLHGIFQLSFIADPHHAGTFSPTTSGQPKVAFF